MLCFLQHTKPSEYKGFWLFCRPFFIFLYVCNLCSDWTTCFSVVRGQIQRACLSECHCQVFRERNKSAPAWCLSSSHHLLLLYYWCWWAECEVLCLFCCFPQVTSSAQGSSSLQRGFWSMPAAWASPSSSGSSVAASALWGHCVTPNWASPSPNPAGITPTWRKSSEDWWGTRDFIFFGCLC